jgi:hypothetical protein
MLKQSALALAATASILTAAAPDVAFARHRTARAAEYVPSSRVWRGDDGRYYCRHTNGTIGLVVGAAGGALIGRAIDSHGDRTTGTIVGAALGALVGREVQKRVSCR